MARYRLGCCIPGGYLSKEHGDTPLTRLQYACKRIREQGFDYAECGVATLMDLPEADLAAARELPVEVCNCFVPAAMPIVGADIAPGSPLYTHVDRVLARMAAVGVELVVFGSGPARHVPKEVPLADGLQQLGRFLTLCGELGEKYGVTVAIEPLCPGEDNAFNFTSEAAAMAALVGSPRVAYIADTYHMGGSGEAPDSLAKAEVLPVHVHLATVPDRRAPGSREDPFLDTFARTLAATDYKGRVSVECNWQDQERDVPAAFAYMNARF